METKKFLEMIISGRRFSIPVFFYIGKKLYMAKMKAKRNSNGYDIYIKLIDVTPG